MKSTCLTALLTACTVLGCTERATIASLPASPDFQQDGPPFSLSDGAASDFFGYAVALSGSTALVGAPRREVDERREQGAAFVYVKNGTEWQLQATLTADDGALSDHFGLSVALSGDTALVGAPGHAVADRPFQGAAYVFVRDGEAWAQQGGALSADDGAAADAFGTSVAITDTPAADSLVVGAPYHDVNGHSDQGAAYAFSRVDGTWAQHGGALIAGDGLAGEVFGSAVAMSGSTALVGAPVHQVGANEYQGGVYVFVDDGSVLRQQGAALVAPDGGAFDQLSACALAGDLALLGAPYHVVDGHPRRGAAYLFSRAGETWSHAASLFASDGADGDQFGSAVALSATAALVAATGRAGAPGSSNGGVYLFRPDAKHVFREQRPVWSTADGVPNEVFGSSLAVFEETALVGVPYRTVGEHAAQGTVYAFTVAE